MSTRREVILSWLCEKRQTWRLCYLLGEAALLIKSKVGYSLPNPPGGLS